MHIYISINTMVETQISQNNICGLYETLPFLFHFLLLEKKSFNAGHNFIDIVSYRWVIEAVMWNPFSLLETGWAFSLALGRDSKQAAFSFIPSQVLGMLWRQDGNQVHRSTCSFCFKDTHVCSLYYTYSKYLPWSFGVKHLWLNPSLHNRCSMVK